MPPKSSQKSPMRIIKKPAPSPAKKTRSTADKTAPQPRPPSKSKPQFTAKICIPHLQFHGDYVVFMAFSEKPPPDVLLALKQNGAKYRKAPPNVDVDMGWHWRFTRETEPFYHQMNKAHREFAKQIHKCITVISKKPESIECPSKPAASQAAARRITNIVKVQ